MKKLFEKAPWLRSVCSGVLICALLLSICLPLMGMKAAEPENPILQAAPQEITVLQAGQARSHVGSGQSTQTDGAGSGGSKTDETAEGEQEQSDPEETDDQTEQGSDTQPEQQPEAKPQQEVFAEASIGTNTDSNKDDAGEEVGETGEEEEELPAPELDLGAVLTWYKYGSQASSMVCAPEESVGKRVLLAQLDNGRLRYDVELSGLDAEDAEITDVQIAAGNGVPQEADARGAIEMELPDGADYQNYILSVSAHTVQKDQNGETVETDTEFTFILRLESGIDLDLQLTWQPNGQATCGANATIERTVKSDTLTDGRFVYELNFTGESADEAQIVSASYYSSVDSGDLDMSGEIQMNVPDGRDTETYYLAVRAEVLGQTIDYTFVITYEDGLDLQLQFTWYEKSVTAQQLLCDADKSAQLSVKHNQIANGELLYKLSLTGKSAQGAQIVSASCGGSEISTDSGSIALTQTEGGTSYDILVTAKAGDRTVRFTIRVRYQSDVSLELSYTVTENGAAKPCALTCENKKSVRSEKIYDDQLPDGLLSYTLRLVGEETDGIEITSVTCYQSGSGSTKTLSAPDGSVTLLLAADGTKGDNVFTVKASGAGAEYTFTVTLEYWHRGDASVQIECTLTDGQQVANGQLLDFRVRAWSEDANGQKTYIVYNGLRTELDVTLDGTACTYTGTASGDWLQFSATPENPEEGDRNEHTLTIRALDEHGNTGEKTITLQGTRAGDGEYLGDATITIDMDILGLGCSMSITVDVLSGEKLSSAVARAVWGYEAPAPFTAKHNMGSLNWSAEYTGDPQDGKLYLARLGNGNDLGSRANALSGSWSNYGTTDEEVFASIDARFGAETPLAILWRCLYKNNVPLGGVHLDLGEFDFTQSSGWLYALNGSYLSKGMGETSLQPGDVVTLRFTLGAGAEMGYSGGYGGSYCVHYLGDGSWSSVSHDLETITVDGVTKTVCRCCGIESEGELCTHPLDKRKYVMQEDGQTCAETCEECGKTIGQMQSHDLVYEEGNEDYHTVTCSRDCGYQVEQAHTWVEESSTATGGQAGVKTERCMYCGETRETEVAGETEHDGGNSWEATEYEHWQVCVNCGATFNKEAHRYSWNGYGWECSCGFEHDDVCDDDNLTYSPSGESGHTVFCPVCDLVHSTQEHHFVDGVCAECGYTESTDPTEPGGGESGGGESGGETGGESGGEESGGEESGGETGGEESGGGESGGEESGGESGGEESGGEESGGEESGGETGGGSGEDFVEEEY